MVDARAVAISVSLLAVAFATALAAEKSRLLATWKGHSSAVESLVFSPDGTKALSGSYDETIKLWDVATGRLLSVWKGHSGWVFSVVFSPDGTKALSGSFDQTIKLWQVRTAAEAAAEAAAGHFINGEQLFRQGDVEQAIASLTKAIELAPDNPQYRQYAAAAFFAKGASLAETDSNEAQVILEKAARLDPASTEIGNRLGALEYQAGRYEAALSQLGKAVSTEPERAWNDYRGLCLARLGRLEEAKEALKKALEGQPRPEGDMRAEAREMLEKIGKHYGRMAEAKEWEGKGDLKAAISEVEAARMIIDSSDSQQKLEALLDEVRKQAEKRRGKLTLIAAGISALVVLVVGGGGGRAEIQGSKGGAAGCPGPG